MKVENKASIFLDAYWNLSLKYNNFNLLIFNWVGFLMNNPLYKSKSYFSNPD
jgi:hypothetical protein